VPFESPYNIRLMGYLGYTCAHMLGNKKTFNWDLNQMKKMLKESMGDLGK
jgi:hypothetical protein